MDMIKKNILIILLLFVCSVLFGQTDTTALLSKSGKSVYRTLNALANSTAFQAKYFQQNGNSFGTTAIIGTNDINGVSIETGGVSRVTISSGGNITTPGVYDYNSFLLDDYYTLSTDSSQLIGNNFCKIGTNSNDIYITESGDKIICRTNSASRLEIDATTVNVIGYGSGNKESSDILKTESNYKAVYATDGSLLEVAGSASYLPTYTVNGSFSVDSSYIVWEKEGANFSSIVGNVYCTQSSGGSGVQSIELTLPITSNLSTDLDVMGTVVARKWNGLIYDMLGGTVFANAANDRVVFSMNIPGATGAFIVQFNIKYRIK
jgi:hypothetical protein